MENNLDHKSYQLPWKYTAKAFLVSDVGRRLVWSNTGRVVEYIVPRRKEDAIDLLFSLDEIVAC